MAKNKKKGKGGKRTQRPPNLNDPKVRGTRFEWLGIEEWIPSLEDSSYTEFYSDNKTRETLGSSGKKAARGTRPFSEAKGGANRRGSWLKKAFPTASKPDLIAIDRKNKRILVGDVTASARSLADLQAGAPRKNPNELGRFREQRHHLEKTIQYAETLAANLPDDMKDFEVVAQDYYREQEPRTSKRVTVFKNGRFVRPSAQWRNRQPSTGRPPKKGGKGPKASPQEEQRKTGDRATDNRQAPPTPPQRKSKSEKRSSKKRSRRIDFTKIRLAASASLKPKFKAGAALAKGLGKDLILGAVINLIQSYLFSKLMNWLLKDDLVKSLNKLEKKKGKAIEDRVAKVILEHVRRLPSRSALNYKIVVESRLVSILIPAGVHWPHDLLIDKVYVTEHHWAKKEGCVAGKVTKDVMVFGGDEELYQVQNCIRILPLTDPKVGQPSLAGKWRSYFYKKGQVDRQHLATYTIREASNPKKLSIEGRDEINGTKMKIFNVIWDGHALRFKVQHRKYREEVSVRFEEWDVMDGYSVLYDGYTRVQSPGSRRWERTTTNLEKLSESSELPGGFEW